MPPSEAVGRPTVERSSSRRAVEAVTLGVTALAYLTATAWLAVRDQLWNDELFTYYFAHLPDFRDVWDQLSTGVEQTPPLYYAMTRGALRAFGDNNRALRLPGLVGVLVACACLYTFVARRSSLIYGLIAALIVLSSQAVFYAHEARPYGVVLGFAAAALLCWQLRGRGATAPLEPTLCRTGVLVGRLLTCVGVVRWAGRAGPARSGTAASSRCPRARGCGSARRTGPGCRSSA